MGSAIEIFPFVLSKYFARRQHQMETCHSSVVGKHQWCRDLEIYSGTMGIHSED